ncbi:LamG domain-containing protein [Labedella populi]|uniref:LamG domain-containing protein n=1 Tax=Labedella populi TaxID=2498850 RepID=A0A3S4E7X1_9MICO|nr:LamG domain-containing protein [Labedella populi]RWZ68389.1 LamG domain-containing protein [Labedella populi]
MDPSAAATPPTVTADLLPAPQIGDGSTGSVGDAVKSGVVRDQVVVSDTVFVGGAFTKARPFGAGVGKSVVARTHLLSYDLKSGVLSDFAPTFNAQVRAVAASPDGARLYVGGDFTIVNGQKRSRLAAFDVATGALIGSFTPVVNKSVSAIAVTATAVYVGGGFTTAAGDGRSRSAAFAPTTGTLLPWNPGTTGGDVKSIVVAAGGERVVLGGVFQSLAGGAREALGMASVTPDTGAAQPWAVGSVIRNGEQQKSGILSLATSGDSVYGTGYATGTGNFEGTFKVRASDGAIEWIEDCRGDTYSVQPVGRVVYTAGHAHDCSNAGSFGGYVEPERYYRAIAFSDAATGTVLDRQTEFWSHAGHPSPSLLHWFPAMDTGAFTGANQGPWDVTTGGGYVLYGGEFRSVNGVKQTGLARFAVVPEAERKNPPTLSGAAMTPVLEAFQGTGVTLSWAANHDRDNSRLRYEVIRDGDLENPVFGTGWIESTFWQRPEIRGVDGGLDPGASYSYRIRTVDPDGNATLSSAVSYTASAGVLGAITDYDRQVLSDAPTAYWPLNETAGDVGYDWAGSNHLTAVPRRVVGIESVPGGRAGDFDGTDDFAVQSDAVSAPQVYSAEAWFSTTSTKGGQIVGFAHTRDAVNAAHDRHVYLTDDGRVVFGVWTDNAQTVVSPPGLNDGGWHHVVVTLGPSGLRLFLDGALVGSRAGDITAGVFEGYWNVGGNTVAGWPGAPSSDFVDGAIDNIALYPVVLSPAAVAAHFDAATSGTEPVPEPEPTPTPEPESPTVIARDGFERSTSSGWGTAESGGSWSVPGSGVSVGSGAGVLRLAPTEQRTAILGAVSAPATDTRMTFRLDQAPGTSPHYVSVIGRAIGSERYTARVILEPTKSRIDIQASGVTLATVGIASSAYAPGESITLRFEVTGTAPTTLRAKAWTGTAEPDAWQLTRTDSKAALQAPGSVGMMFYAGRPTTTTLSVTDYVVVRP